MQNLELSVVGLDGIDGVDGVDGVDGTGFRGRIAEVSVSFPAPGSVSLFTSD